jgi:hypothetical protein
MNNRPVGGRSSETQSHPITIIIAKSKGMRQTGEIMHTKFPSENKKKKIDHIGDFGIDRRIILKRNLSTVWECGRTTAHAVSLRLLIVEVRVRAQSMWDLWLTELNWDRFLSEFFSFPYQYHPPAA